MNPTKLEKGPMGHMLDVRKAMGHIAEASRSWCRAFDVGDQRAIEGLSTVLQEAFTDFSDCSDRLSKSMPSDGQG